MLRDACYARVPDYLVAAMRSVLQMLDEASSPADDQEWFQQLRESMERQPEQWITAVSDTGTLSDARAWTLLSWIELAASDLVRQRSQSILEAAAFARSLLVLSVIDRRDIALVEALLRRGAQLAEVSFVDSVAAGCARARELGGAGFTSLMQAAPTTPATHAEEGEGHSFTFRRRPAGFDVQELERWLAEGDR